MIKLGGISKKSLNYLGKTNIGGQVVFVFHDRGPLCLGHGFFDRTVVFCEDVAIKRKVRSTEIKKTLCVLNFAFCTCKTGLTPV